MFKSIKEFFLGKPKSEVVEQPTPVETVAAPEPIPEPVKVQDAPVPATKKKRTFVKREEQAVDTKPPKQKSRKKK